MGSDTSLVYRNEGYCPVCERKATFSARNLWFRDHLVCAACSSVPRERAAALMLSRLRPNWRNLTIHESSPEPRGISLKLRQQCRTYIATHFFPGQPLGGIVNEHRNENLEAQTFEDGSFDLVVALDVLEHVNRPDDALAEIARTLRPGGMLIFTVPTYKDRTTSERRALYLPDGTIEYLAEPEYHGNPISDEGSLVTFHYGYDLARAVSDWSALEVEVVRFHSHHYGILGEFTEVYVATKSRSADAAIYDRSELAGNFAECDQERQIANIIRRTFESSLDFRDIVRTVHVEDGIFQFIWQNATFSSKQEAVRYYFEDGQRSATRVRELIDRWMPPREKPLSILEFAAGYGAVTRHAKGILAPNLLFSSDIHPQANAFIEREIGVTSIASANVPEAFDPQRKFDVIFVLSFFSHMPRATWGRWLRRLHDCLEPGGLLLFTTHGAESMRYFPGAVLDESGFWFDRSSEQVDLDTADYGQTITSKAFVDASIAALPQAEYLAYEAACWWEHQDLYIVRKSRVD